MSYGLKYYFNDEDRFSQIIRVEIYQKDYTGSTSQISKPGETPVRIIYNASDDIYQPIIGSEATIQFVCETDMQFTEFLNVSRREYVVKILRESKAWWVGFVVPNAYQELFKAPPYIIELKAVDILGDLQNYDYFTNYSQRYYDYTCENRQLSRILSDLLYDIPGIRSGGLLYDIWDFMDIWEDSMTYPSHPDYIDPFELTRIHTGAFLINGKTACNEILKYILSSFNARVYMQQSDNTDALIEIMDIGILADSTIYHREITQGAVVSDKVSVSNHQITVGKVSDGDNTYWVHADQILSAVPGKYQIILNHDYGKELIINGNFQEDLLISNKPFGWSVGNNMLSGNYELRDDGLVITEFSSPDDFVQSLGIVNETYNIAHLSVNIITDGEVDIILKCGSYYLKNDGSWSTTLGDAIRTSSNISLKSDTLPDTGTLSLSIRAVTSATATFAKISGITLKLESQYPDQLPERAKWIGDGADGNIETEETETIIGDAPSESDNYNNKVAYRNWLEVMYYSGYSLTSAGAAKNWKRSSQTAYFHLLELMTLDRVKNKKTPSIKISGSLISKDMTFRDLLIIPELSNKKFIKGYMEFDMKKCIWSGDWIEHKGYYGYNGNSYLLQQTGDYLVQQTGEKILVL